MPLHKRRIHRILVIKNRAIGDTILMTGPLRLLKARFPLHKITVLVRSPAGELLEGLPCVDCVISAREPAGTVDRFAYWVRLIRRLRTKRYDLVLNFHASFRTALTAKFLQARRCGANHHELRGPNWFSDIKVPGRGVVKPIIERDLDLLRAVGIEASAADALPELVLTALEREEARRLVPDEAEGGPLVFLGVGASRATKRWPAEHFAALAARMAGELGARFVLATIPEDDVWLDRFLELARAEPALDGRIRHFRSLRLRQVARILSRCQAYIGNDSGLKHVAAALGVRTLTFFGPEAPLEWHPYEPESHPYLYIDGLACRTETGRHWCPIPVCERHVHRCLKELLPGHAWDAAARLLGDPAKSRQQK